MAYGDYLTADVQEVLPYAGAEERVHADGRLVEDEQLGLVEEGRCEGGAPLLPPGEVHNESLLRRQVEELDEELGAGADLVAGHVEDAAEVGECLGYCELAVERQLLRHVADPAARDPRPLCPRLAAKHGDAARPQSLQVAG